MGQGTRICVPRGFWINWKKKYLINKKERNVYWKRLDVKKENRKEIRENKINLYFQEKYFQIKTRIEVVQSRYKIPKLTIH